MSDYISRRAAIEAIEKCQQYKVSKEDYAVDFAELKTALMLLPTTADVVRVVRCKDCKHRHDSLLNGSPLEDFCDVFPAYICKDDYCNYGERAYT